MFRRVWFYVFGSPAVAANPGDPNAVPPVPATPAAPPQRGLWWAQTIAALLALAIVYGALAWVGAFHWGWPFWGNQKASAVSPPAESAQEALEKAIGSSGRPNVYLHIGELDYADGQAGLNMTAARKAEAEKEKADAEVRAARVRAALKKKAAEMQRMGAYLIQRGHEEREAVTGDMEITRRNAAAAYHGTGQPSALADVHLAEAEAGSANYHNIRGEGFRLYYRGLRMEATIALEEANAEIPEVRTRPQTAPAVTPPAAKPSPKPEASSQFRLRTPPGPYSSRTVHQHQVTDTEWSK